MKLLPALLLCAFADTAMAQSAPIAAVRLEGNRVTRDKVILREMDLRAGDVADAAAIERNRQAILDLGLFREVDIATEMTAAGVVLVVKMREKRYLLPIPRVDTSSDEDFSYGAQLRWSNVFGLNHRLNAYYEEGDFPNERDRASETTARVTYAAPRVWDSRFDVRGRLEHEEQRTRADTGDYDETFGRVEMLVARDFTTARPRRGWIAGGGLYFEDQGTSGEFAPPPDGHVTALVGIATYDNLRFDVYSETGTRFSTRVEGAVDGFASDYDYTRSIAAYFHSRPLGDTPHQTLHLLAQGGLVTDGPRSRNNFSLGGSGRLRGYESDFVEGDRFYYGAIEYLRPIRWRWLRLFATAEVGGADDDIRGEADGSLYASLGVGVRVRLTWFVDVEIEAGIAVPLRGGDGPRFFAGGNQ